ncbi:MAG: TonB-dependent receptor [Bacteroidota bacterium]
MYNVANNATTNTNRSAIGEKEVQSVFGSLSMGFGNFLYLDVTGRNDWSSTLPIDNNSYFYPSVSLSAVLTDAFSIQSPFLTYAKVRGSWAQVGNDTDPYALEQVFVPRDPWNASTPIFSENTNIANNGLKPELTTGIEFGADLRFFNNRLGLDVTYYDQTTTDQIIGISVSKATGYNSKLINAGEINNRGVEVMLYGTPIKTSGGFTWDVTLNYAKNRNEVVELFTDENGNELETIVLYARRGLSLEARVGEPYGTLVGSAYKRVEEGEYA